LNIYVGNLAFTVTRDELQQQFTSFGQVVSISMMNDRYIGSGQQRGYGYVEMAVRTEAEAAIAGLDGKTLGGRPISLVEARALSTNDIIPVLRAGRRNRPSVRRDR
jgi:RNA recognition motif-containing protein